MNSRQATIPSDDFDDDDDLPVSQTGPARRPQGRRLMLDLLGRWHWVVLGLILGTLTGAYYLSKAPKKYAATSTLLVKQQTAGVMGTMDQAENIDMRTIEGLNTVAERIRRHELLARVAARPDVRALPGLIPQAVEWMPEWLSGWVEHLKPGSKDKETAAKEAQAGPPTPAVLGRYLAGWMDISIRRGTRLLDITITHEVPEVAKALADAVAREYLAEIAGAVAEGRSSKSDALVKQSEETRVQLQIAERALSTYIRALALHEALEAQEKTKAQLAHRYLPKHPKMAAAVKELEETEARFLTEFHIAISSPADAAYWETVKAEFDATRDDPPKRLQVARQLLLARTGVLQGETKSQMSVFDAMLIRLKESQVNSTDEDSSAEISSFAQMPGIPTDPVPPKVYAVCCAGGLALGLLLAFGLIRMDNQIRSVAQLEEDTHISVLAAISDIDISHLNLARKAATKAAAKDGQELDLNPLQENWEPRLLFRPGTASTSYAEMFRVLRASVSLLGDEAKRKITLISSALPGEGKSTVSANLALAAAGQGRKTIIVDLDLRKPHLHREFGFERTSIKAGITEWLAGQLPLEDVIVRDVGANDLHAIFCGARAPNPGELLNAAKLKQLFAALADLYDHVVVDSAPLLAVPDTRVIAPLVDNFCLVVSAAYTPRGAVLRVLELLNSAGSPPSGLVLNGFKESRRMMGQNYSYGGYRMSRYGKPYQYGYGSYGSYGAYGSDESDDGGKRSKRKKSAGKS